MAALRRGIGIGAIRQPVTSNSGGGNAAAATGAAGAREGGTNKEDFGRQLTEKRLADIAQAAELLEGGIRKFVTEHKDEIRGNAFLREKVQALADSCNVDLGAAISDTPRLKPGTSLTSMIGDALLGAPLGVGGAGTSSSESRRFLSFLSSRVVALCMRERVLRGPVVPMTVVLRELRKRYPLEELNAADIVRAIEFLAPLNSNIFVLHQETAAATARPNSDDGANAVVAAAAAAAAVPAPEDSLFVAFRPLETPHSIAHLTLAAGSSAAALSGSDALRVVVLANDIARARRTQRAQMLSASRFQSNVGGGFLAIGAASALAARANAKQQQPQADAAVVTVDAVGIVDGEQRGSYYVRVTPTDVLNLLSPTSPTSTTTKAAAAAAGADKSKSPWTLKRARLALKAVRAMHDGWLDAMDGSTWLLVLLQ